MSLFDDILEEDDELDFETLLEVSPPQKQRVGNQVQGMSQDEEIENVFEEEKKVPIFSQQTRVSRFQNPNQDICPYLKQIPSRFRSVFPYKRLNRVQSASFDVVFKKGINSVICAPTSSGKTCLFELAMVRMFHKVGGHPRGKYKAVYVSPLKALCQERLNDWVAKFSRLGIKVMEVTGDTGNVRVRDLEFADILVTTPEKWDSITRRWREASINSFLQNIGLFLVDEVHLLNDKRGAVLEVIVCRMLAMKRKCLVRNSRAAASNLRVMAISATVPNVEDVAAWLKAPPNGMLNFGEEYRPVPLTKLVFGFNNNRSDYLFLQNLNYKLPDIIKRNSSDRPTIVFCSSRKGCEKAAKHLFKCKNMLGMSLPTNLPEARQIKRKDLQELVRHGIAFHSAGLQYDDRRLIEELFQRSAVKIICSTTTLSQGVNLPAHLVVIKGTKIYRRGSGYVEQSVLNIKQMCGRAGRPQFDKFGTAVIMTEQSQKGRYENLVNNRLIVESHLKGNLIEHLNSEIVLQNVTTFKQAEEWIKSTFLYVRAKKRPDLYGLSNNIDSDFNQILRGCFEQLFNNNLIIEQPPNSGRVVATDIGKCMSKYYISFKTMVIFSEIKGRESLENLLVLSCRSEELSEYNFRMGEKGVLNKLKKSVRFQIKDKKVKTVDQKMSILVQCVLQRVKIEKSELRIQAVYIVQNVLPRIVKAISEYSKTMQFYTAYRNSIMLLKCLERKLLEESSKHFVILT